MRFLGPHFFLLLIPWALLPGLWLVLEKNAQKKFSQFIHQSLLSKLGFGYSYEIRKKRFLFLFFSLFFLILALTRPQFGSHEESVKSYGLDLVFLLDTSNSMLTEDMAPNRLKKAKHIIRNFVDRLKGDRIGIVAFAGSAYPAVPLTTDYAFITQALESLDERSIANQGTNIEKAISVAVELLQRGGTTEQTEESDLSQSSRVLVLISDGETHDAVTEAKILKYLKDNSVRVFTIGIGSLKGAPIPIRNDEGMRVAYKKDDQGNMVLSRLEAQVLENIAAKAGGKYYSASINEGEVEEIVSQMHAFDRVEGSSRTIVVYGELYQFPLFLAILLLFFFLIRSEKKAITMCFLLLLSSQAKAINSLEEHRETKKGIEAYDAKDYSEAVRRFGNAQAVNPKSTIHRFNLGDGLLQSKDYNGAANEFKEIFQSKDLNMAIQGGYNLGKAYEGSENYEDAIRTYQETLNRIYDSKEKPDPAIINKIKKALEVTQQQKQQKDSSQQKEKGDNKKSQDTAKDDSKKDFQNYKIPKQKPQFKAEKLSENDAKRILMQLQEQERKTQAHLMQKRTQAPKDKPNAKDW